MGKSGISIDDLQDFDGWTTRVYVIDIRKLRRIAMGREARNGGKRPSIAQLIHEAVREMDEP